MSYTIDIRNKSSKISSPHITFVQAKGSTVKLEVSDAKGKTLENAQDYLLSELTLPLSVNSFDWQGKLFISDSSLSLTESNGVPTDPNYWNPTDTTRFQAIELAGNTSTANPDITYINWYSIPLQLQVSSNSKGCPKSQTALDGLLSALVGLSGDPQDKSTPTLIFDSNNQVVRVISPNASGKWLEQYPDFSEYIQSVFHSQNTILLENDYNGIQSSNSVLEQKQKYVDSTVTYQNEKLTITGNTNKLGDYSMSVPSMDIKTFSENIYLAVLNYKWTYGKTGDSPVNGSGNTGDNNVFSAISRDLLAGFAFGFIESNKFGKKPSSSWMSATSSEVFNKIQNKPFYNQWASVINTCFTDVYSFPFNDFLGDETSRPTLPVNSGDKLTVILLSA